MKITIYDALETAPVGQSWALGARLYKLFGFIDHYIAAQSWEHALTEAVKLGETRVITEIQFWGHGAPGRILINKERLLADKTHDALLKKLTEVLSPTALVWFRTCSSFAGEAGQRLALALAQKLARRVAGSTYLIGFPWHSGQRSVRPGAVPNWSAAEGFDGDGKTRWSERTAPNTLPFTARELPSAW